MRAAWILVFAAGCAREGVVLDVGAKLDCAPLRDRVRSVQLEVTSTPLATSDGQKSFPIQVTTLDAFRTVLLFPDATTHIKVDAEARDEMGERLAIGTIDVNVERGIRAETL